MKKITQFFSLSALHHWTATGVSSLPKPQQVGFTGASDVGPLLLRKQTLQIFKPDSINKLLNLAF